MVPDGWRQSTLGYVASVTTGGTPSRTASTYWCGEIPWIRTTEVQNCLLGPNDVKEFISQEGLRNSSAKLLAPGTILLRYSQGLVSDTWNLKFPNFSEVEVSVPTRSEQEAIADILNGCDNQTATLTRHAQNLCRQKKALMQQLLTGKRRVKVAA